MGTPISPNDVSNLIDQYVHFASPRFWNDPPCVNGKVKYIQASKDAHVVYLEPYGQNYLVRVDVNCYAITEKIEEDEQHSSH